MSLSENDSEITCSTAIRINESSPYLLAFGDSDNIVTYFITGHADGYIYFWKNFELVKELTKKE